MLSQRVYKDEKPEKAYFKDYISDLLLNITFK